MSLSLLLASTFLAAPTPCVPEAQDDTCPQCGCTIHSKSESGDGKTIERIVRRALGKAGGPDGKVKVFKARPEAEARTYSRTIVVGPDGVVHESGDEDAPRAFAWTSDDGAQELRVQLEVPDIDVEEIVHEAREHARAFAVAPRVRARGEHGAPRAFAWTSKDGPHEIDVDVEAIVEEALEHSGKAFAAAPRVQLHREHGAPRVFSWTSEDGPHEIDIDIPHIDVEKIVQQAHEHSAKAFAAAPRVQLHREHGAPRVFSWTSEDGPHEIDIDIDIPDVDVERILEHLQQQLEGVQTLVLRPEGGKNEVRRVLERVREDDADGDDAVDELEAEIEALKAELRALERSLRGLHGSSSVF